VRKTKNYIDRYKKQLISLFFFISLISCYKDISLEWRIIGEPENKTVKLVFFNAREVELTIGDTKNIKIPFNADYFGKERPGSIIVCFRPDFIDLTNINNNEKIEAFVFPLSVNQTSISDTIIKINFVENNDGLAYFYKFNVNDKIYIAISVKNQFVIDKDNLIINDEPDKMDVIFFRNMDDGIFVYYSDFATCFLTDDFYDYGGYIVQSRIDATAIWLDPNGETW